MSVTKKIIKSFVFALLAFHGLSLTVKANSVMLYEQWKAQQERHDIRIAQLKTTSVPQQHLPITLKSHTVEKTIKDHPQTLGTGLKVNINTASAQELSAKLDSIGAKKAQAIVKYRQKHGNFKHIHELKNVKGIGDKIFQRNQDRIKLTD